MYTALVRDKRNDDQNEHYDQDDALFVLCEFENAEKAFHSILANSGICGLPELGCFSFPSHKLSF